MSCFYLLSRLLLPQIFQMEARKKSKGLYWLLFLISALALGVAIFLNWPWLTLILPFMFTFFVLAMDLI